MSLLNNNKQRHRLKLGKKTLHADVEQKLFDIIIEKDLTFKAIEKSQSDVKFPYQSRTVDE